MLHLSRTGIRNLAVSDTVYARGLNYYKSNRVTNAVFSKNVKQYKLNVMGSYQYKVVITEQDDGSFEHTCNCPAHVKEKGICKHEVAALLFLLKYQEKSMMEAPHSPEERKAFQVLDYFANQEELRMGTEVFHIETTISLPFLLRDLESKALVSFRAGNKRLYKIAAVKKFIADYNQGENIILGKEFKFIAGESEFDKASQELLDFLIEIHEIQQFADRGFYTPNQVKSQMMFSKRMLLKLLQVLGKSKFHLELYGKTYEGVRFVKGNPEVSYNLDVFEDALLLNFHEGESVIPLSENGELLYFDGIIYQTEKRFLKNFLPFYNTLEKDKKPLLFRGENKIRFLEEVLPRLHDTMEINIPESLKSRYLTFDLQAELYLDRYHNDIKAVLKFKYGEYEFNCFAHPKAEGYIIVRQKEKEYELMRLLESMDFEPHSSFYLLKNENSMFDFLQEKLQELNSLCQLYYSEDFKRLSVRTGGKFSVGLKTGVDLLEMDLEFGDVPKEELASLFRSYQLKKKYYRLKSGDFIRLDNQSIKNMAEILDNLSLSVQNISDGNLKITKNSAFYLDEAFDEDYFQVEKDFEFTSFIKRVLSPSDAVYELPDNIKATLHPYQVTGFRWLSVLADNELGGILADDMGLGKTLQTITYITSRMGEGARFLIVCPTSLVYNWMDEFENFSPDAKVLVVSGIPAERKELLENSDKFDVLITSYPLMRRDVSFYQKMMFDTVFIDEAQFIKNAVSLNARSVKVLNSKHRFALTGTPIENSLSELWSIFDFIMPGYLMSHSKFIQQYERLILREDETALESLNRKIQPFVLRRMKKDVLFELPDKTEEKILIEMSEEQKKVYLSYMESIRKELKIDSVFEHADKNQMKILAALTRLRQICCHPSTFLNDYHGGSGKTELLFDVLHDAIANKHRILLFSQFTSMLHIIEEELKQRKLSYFYLEGSTPMADRSEYVRKFNSGEGDVFLISLKAGGTGLNLTGADMVIHYDPWWNPAVEDQATDRAYRIGQEKNVHVIKLITRGTIEEKIYKLQKKKKELLDSVIQSKEVFINLLTREELEDIFK